MDGILMYLGIALMVLSALCAVIFLAVFSITGKRLKLRLDREFGEKRR